MNSSVYRITPLFYLRPDFAIEVGWLEAVSTPVSEDDWKAGRLWSSIAELYGPTKIASYEHYLHALARLKPTPLMFYCLGVFQAGSPSRAVVSSRKNPAFVEYTRFCAESNLLFRQMISRAEAMMGLIPGCRSPLRPILRGDNSCGGASHAIIHDTGDGNVYVADLPTALKLVQNQKDNFADTLAAFLAANRT